MPSPKIIFIGGSSSLFGIDAAEVQKSLGIPALNFGLHAGLRLEDHLANACSVAKPGDIVILCLEPAYYDYYTETWTTWTLRNALAWNRSSLDSLSFKRRLEIYLKSSDPSISWDLIETKATEGVFSKEIALREKALEPAQAIVTRYLSEQGTSRTFSYKLSNLDSNGDLLNARNIGLPFHGDAYSASRPASISSYAKNQLVPFLKQMKKDHVRVIFDYTPYLVYGKPDGNWQKADANFKANLNGLGGELLETRAAFFYPNTFFFNSNLHLNEAGKQVRTQTLIEALRKKLNLNPAPSPR